MADSISTGQAYLATSNNVRSLPDTKDISDPKQARETAKEFEAVFLSQMLKPIFESVKLEAPFGGGMGEEMWRSMQVDEYGKAIANAGGIGIADAVFREMIKQQEAH
jgi:peptidoglycan hydrolase FlgJ